MILKNPFKNFTRISPIRLIVGSFLFMIIIGTILLSLPISYKNHIEAKLIDTFFIATSATCVTGLSTFDTWETWSWFGQIVLLLLIQFGGLGLIIFTTGSTLIIKRKLDLRYIRLAKEYTNGNIINIKKLIYTILFMSFICEIIGALLLCIVFIPKYGLYGIWISLFTSISSYCNAGFDLMGIECANNSLISYYDNLLVNILIITLIIIGGIGFIVISDLYTKITSIVKKEHKYNLSIHSTIVLKMTALLLSIGFVCFFLIEYNHTLKGMNITNKILVSLFQSTSCRTAGFFSIPINQECEFTKIITIILMFIGASPSSTGGGIKTTTLLVLFATISSVLKGHNDTRIKKHSINKFIVYKAMTITFIAFFLILISITLIDLIEKDKNLSMLSILFEVVSAFGTVGLSTGITSILSIPSKLILCILMFIGRVGPISLVLALTTKHSKKMENVYPEGKVLIG